MAKIGFISLGCAKNQVDCERMMFRVQDAGFEVRPDVIGSDVVVINTCGFIDSAKTEAIDAILRYGNYENNYADNDPIKVITLKKVDDNNGSNIVARNVTGKYVYENRKVFEFEVRL